MPPDDPLRIDEEAEPLLLKLSNDGKQIVLQASQRKDLGAEMRRELAAWKDAEAVPWRFLMRLCAALRQRGSVSEVQSDEAWLHVVTAGSQLVLPSPQRTVDPAYEERRAELRLQAQEREYQSLVSDLTRTERHEKERVGFGDALKEVGYGMHVITVMFTCFIAGYVVGRRLSSDKTVQYGVGCMGMIAALMVEAGLFMIRFQRLWDDDGKGQRGHGKEKESGATFALGAAEGGGGGGAFLPSRGGPGGVQRAAGGSGGPGMHAGALSPAAAATASGGGSTAAGGGKSPQQPLPPPPRSAVKPGQTAAPQLLQQG